MGSLLRSTGLVLETCRPKQQKIKNAVQTTNGVPKNLSFVFERVQYTIYSFGYNRILYGFLTFNYNVVFKHIISFFLDHALTIQAKSYN